MKALSILTPQDEASNWSADASGKRTSEGTSSVDLSLRRFITAAELKLAFLRAPFCLTLFAVFLANNDLSLPVNQRRVVLEVAVLTLAMLVSAGMFLIARSRVLDVKHTWISVAADVSICTAALMTNTLNPPPQYLGVADSLDVAAVLLTIMASVLRLNLGAVFISGSLTVLGLGLILFVENRTGFPLHENKLRVLSGYVLGTVALCVLIVVFARQLLRRVAAEATRAERARGSVLSLLQDHHDHRSVLFNIRLNIESVAEKGELDLGRMRKVSSSLESYCDALESTRKRSLAALRGLDQLARTSVIDAVAAAANDTDGLEIEVQIPATLPPVLYGGGVEGLRFQIGHLLRNAREGNGIQGATHVVIRACTQRSGNVLLTLDDNGPGFDAEHLGMLGRKSQLSAKPGSWGLGLWLASRTLQATGGSLRFLNLPNGGARVSVRLPQTGNPN